MTYNHARLRRLNAHATHAAGDYVLYWMQAHRRLERNHALGYALRCAGELQKPLVIYEGVRVDYPWSNRRLHSFLVEGMVSNATRAEALGLNYWPFVETTKGESRGLLARLSARACLVVTDDFPCFIIPGQTSALARAVSVPVLAVDSNSIVPLSLLGRAVSAAAHLRPRIHKAFAEAWAHRTPSKDPIPEVAARRVEAPFEATLLGDVPKLVESLPIDPTVRPVPTTPGGAVAGRKRLRAFLRRGLVGYAAERSEPRSLAEGHASGLSPYLHFGHISVEEVVEGVLRTAGRFGPDELRVHNRGKREGYFGEDPDVNAFLDQVLTWRDVGLQWMWSRRERTITLESALPAWAQQTLVAHRRDKRPWIYTAEEFEAGCTHDPLWNAAQRELVTTGTIHNYLRMLWGKKVLEWSASPAEAYRTLEHLNNKYAIDGRDPNSYTGILWCLGLFDRPWPQRAVFGTVRYMSSQNTARKFDLKPYYAYVETLQTIAEARGGTVSSGCLGGASLLK